MLLEERRSSTVLVAAHLAARLTVRELEEPRVLARVAEVASRLVSAVERAVDDEERAQLAPAVRVADPESAAALCQRCGVAPLAERPGSSMCDVCWVALCVARGAAAATALDRNVKRALTFNCPACDAAIGEGCRGLQPGDTVHGVRLEQVLGLLEMSGRAS